MQARITRMLAILDFFSHRQVAAAREGSNGKWDGGGGGAGSDASQDRWGQPEATMRKVLLYQQFTRYPASSSDPSASPMTRPEPARTGDGAREIARCGDITPRWFSSVQRLHRAPRGVPRGYADAEVQVLAALPAHEVAARGGRVHELCVIEHVHGRDIS